MSEPDLSPSDFERQEDEDTNRHYVSLYNAAGNIDYHYPHTVHSADGEVVESNVGMIEWTQTREAFQRRGFGTARFTAALEDLRRQPGIQLCRLGIVSLAMVNLVERVVADGVVPRAAYVATPPASKPFPEILSADILAGEANIDVAEARRIAAEYEAATLRLPPDYEKSSIYCVIEL